MKVLDFKTVSPLFEMERDGVKPFTIRRIEHSDHEYLAYAKSLCGKATYFLYFRDDIWGAVVLCNFVQMLKSYFQPERIKLTIHENAVCLKNEQILALLNEEP